MIYTIPFFNSKKKPLDWNERVMRRQVENIKEKSSNSE